MFGISSVPEKYKPVIQKVLKYCSGTENISDDIIIYGPNRAENDKRLEKVLTTLKDRGLTLVKEKCIFHIYWLNTMTTRRESRSIEPST